MNKKIIHLLIAIFCSILSILMPGCRSTLAYTDVIDQPPYKDLVGKHFTILKDCYLVSIPGNLKPGLRLCGSGGLPQELDRNKIGETIDNENIIELVPKNSEFTLMKIVKYDLVDHIHVVILLPVISLSSQFNDVAASILKKEYTESDVFEFNSDLVKEVPSSTIEEGNKPVPLTADEKK